MNFCKKYGSYSKGKNNIEKEQDRFELNKEKAIDYYFQANSVDHSLTQYHIVFHTFLIIAITSSSDPKSKFIISILGIFSSIISFFTFLRASSFTSFWKKKYLAA